MDPPETEDEAGGDDAEFDDAGGEEAGGEEVTVDDTTDVEIDSIMKLRHILL